MIEVISIFYQILFFLLIFSISKNIFLSRINTKKNVPEIILSNSVIISYLLLIFSIVNFYIPKEIFIVIFLSLVCVLIFKRNNYFLIQNLHNYVFLIIFLLIFSLEIAYYLNLEWDGLAHWFYKTQLFYNNGSIFNLSELNFNHYPHLGPYIWSFFWKISISQHEYLGRLYPVFLYIAVLLLILDFVKVKNLNLKFLILILLSAFSYDKYLFSGYMEYFLFIYTFLCSYYFFNIIIKNNKIDYVFFFLSSALIPWFKFEGLFIFIILNLSLILFSDMKIKNKFFYFVFILLYIYLFDQIKSYLVPFQGEEEKFNANYLINFFFQNEFLERIIIITKGLFISFFKYPFYLLYCFSIIYFLFFSNEKYFYKYKKFFYAIIFYFFCNIILIYLIFLFLPEREINNIVPVVIDRLLFQNLFFYAIPVTLIFKNLFKI